MNPNVTFFYNQNESRGSTWQATVRVQRDLQGRPEVRTVTLYLYAGNGNVSPPAIDSERILKDGEYKNLLGKITKQIRPGLILEEEADASGSELRCQSAGMEARPKKALRLRPGYPADFVSFDKELEILAGGHLIVPVDSTAHERLEDLLAQLKWLSPDIESLVLNTIWRPGVDRRIDRIERRLGIPGDVHAEALSSWQRWWARGCRFGKRTLDATLRYSPVLACVLLVVLLAGNTQISWSAVPSEEAPVEVSGPADAPTENPKKPEEPSVKEEAEAPGTGGAGEDPNDEIAAQLKKLDETLSGLVTTSLESRLYTSHFAEQPVTSIDTLVGNEAFAWGFVKLVYLRVNGAVNVPGNGGGGNITTIVGSVSQRSWTRVMLEKMLAASLTKEEKAALALVTCQAFERDQAGLPGDSRPEGQSRDWKFQIIDMEQSCPLAGTDLVLAAAGLRSLNDYLETLPKAGGN